jgi:hypothetical protein
MSKGNHIYCFIFSACLATAIAIDYTFTNTAGGSWGNEENWSPKGVPGANDDGKRIRSSDLK